MTLLEMKRDNGKTDNDGFDQECNLYIGPSSRPFSIANVAKSPYLTQKPAQHDFSHDLSPRSMSKLAGRCSTKAIREDVERVASNTEVAEALRTRMLSWAESSGIEDGSKKRKRSERLQSKVAEDDDDDSISKALEEVDRKVPNSLR